MTARQEEKSLASISQRVSDRFNVVDEGIKQHSPRSSTLKHFQDLHQRFTLWAFHICALQLASNVRSLEHRLRNAPMLWARYWELLHDIEEDLTDLWDCLQECMTSPESSGKELGLQTGAPYEIDEALEGIDQSIRFLFKSNRIALSSDSRDRYSVAMAAVPATEVDSEVVDFDTMGDLFPRLRPSSHDWLRRRLATANNMRRRYLRYRQLRHDKPVSGIRKADSDFDDLNTTASTVEASLIPEAATRLDLDDVASIVSYNTVSMTPGSNSISVRKCPFCDWHTKLHYAGSKEQVSIDRYRRHICAHLEQVALAVIGEAVDESEQGGSDAQGQLNRGFDFGSEDEGQDDTWSTTTDDEDVTYQGNDYASQSPMSRDAKHTVGIDAIETAAAEARRPVYPKVHTDYLAVESLKYYDLPWEYDRRDPKYIIILRDMGERETDLLFEHTRRLRAGKLSWIGASRTDKQFALHEERRKAGAKSSAVALSGRDLSPSKDGTSGDLRGRRRRTSASSVAAQRSSFHPRTGTSSKDLLDQDERGDDP
ncbi:hypothetical protein CLAFUR4_08000 [Fulvia fulva]|nr:hypothetical protein CLAFUR4_08000 [Fulvia fulva]WPV27470.1 hypothetical protein CLAFUW7_07995 [Fulvia fulva]